ncbi:MAG: hypothetical protein NVS1B5_14540 [Gemmatimonadaceae bacterium]
MFSDSVQSRVPKMLKVHSDRSQVALPVPEGIASDAQWAVLGLETNDYSRRSQPSIRAQLPIEPDIPIGSVHFDGGRCELAVFADGGDLPIEELQRVAHSCPELGILRESGSLPGPIA